MSIGQEMILAKAKIAARNQELKELGIKADNEMIVIRQKIDPNGYDEDFCELDIEAARVAINVLAGLRDKANELKAKNNKARRNLNG
jgi:hypothetical protein